MASKLIDLSYPISAGMTRYPLQPAPEIEVVGSRLRAHILTVGSHVGTHVDAPIHAIDGGRRMDELELERFMGTAVVSSVSRAAGEEITVDDVLNGGPAPERGEALLIHTGWEELFHDEVAYEDHPWLAVEVAEWAVDLGLSMVGTDTFSPDQPIERRSDDSNFQYPVHRTLLSNEVLIIENLANLASVSGQRGRYYAFPVYTLSPGGDAGHVRFVWEPIDA